jgi:hypothetical protein
MGQLRCGEGCGDLVVISTTGDDGCEITLRACPTCGGRSWTRDGRVTPLPEVLVGLGGRPVELLRAS